MIEDRIQKIEDRIQAASHLPPELKAELLDVTAQLRKELLELHSQSSEKAHAVTELTETSANHATNPENNVPSIEKAIQELNESVEEFEVSHPDLAAALNRMAMILANMGI